MLEDQDADLIRIRAHHLLCLQGFQGYGYDQEFSMRMGEILRTLKSDPSPRIEIITDADEICSSCPKLIENQCVDHLKIKKMDSDIIESVSLEENQVVTFKTAVKIIDKELRVEALESVCKGCVWMDKCLFFINKINSNF